MFRVQIASGEACNAWSVVVFSEWSISFPVRSALLRFWAAIPIIIPVIRGVIVLYEDKHSFGTAVSPAVIGSGCLQSPLFSLWRDMECIL